MTENFKHLCETAFKYFDEGKCKDAIDTIRLACKIAEESVGCNDPIYAILLGNYGYFLFRCNPCTDSIKYLEKAKNIFEENNFFDSEDYQICLNNLAIAYHSIGRESDAKLIYNNALKLVNRDKFPLTYATLLMNNSSFLQEDHNYKQALLDLFEAKSIFEQQKATKRFVYFGILMHIGLCYGGEKKFDKAELYFNLALDLSIELGIDNSAILNNFALIYIFQGRYNEAIDIYKKLEKRIKLNFGDYALNLIDIYDNLSGAYIGQKNYGDAVKIACSSSIIIERYLSEFAGFLLDTQLNEPISKFRRNIDVICSIFYVWESPTQESIINAYSMLFRRKALFLKFEMNRQKLFFSENSDKYQNEIHRLKILKSQLGHLKMVSLRQNLNLIKQIEKEIYELSSKIPYNFQELSDDFNEKKKYDKILEKISPNSILIDYVKYTNIDFQKMAVTSPRYAQFIITKQSGIQIKDLGPANEIDYLIKNATQTISDPFNSDLTNIVTLSKKIITPISSLLQGKKQVYIIPDGLLNLVPFAILIKDDEYLLNNYEIIYLTSSRDLLNHDCIQRLIQTNSIIIADPDFGLIEDNIGEPQQIKSTNSQSFLSECLRPIGKLEATREEGERIQKIIGGNLWIGRDALKSRLMNVQSPKYLHIATHGFFCPETQKIATKINFLLRTGLLLAGVELYLDRHKYTKNAGNGIVTAYEISMLNLRSTELVVLSSCGTGKGEIINSEGVFGLRRAFSIAGVKSLIMSLWDVDDDATKDLMISFYTQLNSGVKISEALRQAQLSTMVKYSHPYYWGAFILQGNFERDKP